MTGQKAFALWYDFPYDIGPQTCRGRLRNTVSADEKAKADSFEIVLIVEVNVAAEMDRGSPRVRLELLATMKVPEASSHSSALSSLPTLAAPVLPHQGNGGNRSRWAVDQVADEPDASFFLGLGVEAAVR